MATTPGPLPPRFGIALSARIYTCVCGFVPPTLTQQQKHRKRCWDWRNRADPRGLMIARGRAARLTPETVLHCHVCHRIVDHHAPSCPYSFSEVTRREAVERAGIAPNQFYVFLVALRRRYPGGFGG